MAKIKDLRFTEDPMSNIELIVPLLNDESRKAVSYLMYGCYLGEAIAEEERKTGRDGPADASIEGR